MTGERYIGVAGRSLRYLGVRADSVLYVGANALFPSGTSYDTDAQAYFDAMTTHPDSTRKGLINDLITGLKSDGIWSHLDVLALRAAHDSQAALVNAVHPSKVHTAHGSLTFTADAGYKGDGSSAYISYGEASNAAGNLYSLNNAAFGIFVNISDVSGNGLFVNNDEQDFSALLFDYSPTVMYYAVNDADFGAKSGAIASSIGHFAAARGSSSVSRIYEDGIILSTDTSASMALPAGNTTIIGCPAYGSYGAIGSYAQVAADWRGENLTDAQIAALHSRLRTYLGAIGAVDNTPAVVGTTPFVSGTGAISPTFAGTGRQAGDLLILAVESANQAVTTPSGWTAFSTSPQSTGTAGAAGGVRLSAFYKISDGTETTISIADSGDHTTAAGIAVRGVDATTPINATAGSVHAATTSVSFPAVTTDTAHCLIINMMANDRDATATNNLSAVANTNLTNLTKQVDATNSAGTGGGVAIITGGLAAAGSSGNTTATNAASVTNALITIALKPA